ncbi:MoxR family ATPase [Victivallaceae bacterium BBE-744-WT-12]|uniref:MoxR family ATPase n=1 Tax=Victivallis lenta TaxID=2606640 RepID=A0A844FY13_9BACT|nr:MoxR family ATPase [Victivallis lenta]AVM44662.1 magnesium chelatase [Victivallales bacterium CCUG 44730]MBS1454376.1 MoxR family ATPase [Lentisphaeria bacterium]MST95624.1 MoxR family ATPase [Victivallis lenta]HBP07582.1 MoxR family ATPase [Lentisphaeria bacterium]
MPTPIEKLAVVESELNRIIRGKADVIRHLLTAFVAGGNILLDDVPGVGKTTLAKALARLVDAKFSRIQFTPDLLPADITGTSIYNPSTGQFQFRPGPVFTNILLADEINRASPRTQSALLECMCEHQVSPDGQSRILEAPFMVIATQNPIEYQGTYPLPEAQLDRFAMRLTLGYPDEEAEREMLYDRRHIDPLESLKPEISCQEVLDLQADMKKVGMEASVSAYLLTIVQSTRRDARLTLGASPRAAIRLADCSRSLALISGREFVLPDDVRELAPLVLSHRLVVDAKTRYAGVSAQEIVAEIVQSVKVPL